MTNDGSDTASHLLPIPPPDTSMFRELAETLPALCWMATPEGEIFWANAQWHAYTGTTPQEAAADGWTGLFDQDELPGILGQWASAVASGQHFEAVISMRGADGHLKPFLARVSPVVEAGSIVRWSGINFDVAELHQQQQVVALARNDLASELDDLKRLFAQSPSFMAMLRGPDHRIVLTNPPYMQLIGHREVLGRTVAEALSDAAAQGYVELLDQVYRSGKAYSSSGAKYAVETVPGGPVNERYVDFVYQPVQGPSGDIIGIFVDGYDVTERIAAEERLRTALAEKQRLAEHNEMIAREMSHRIMNSFQLMEGMFRVQTRQLTDPAAKAVVDQAGQRLQAMALVHRHLFRITRDDITELNVTQFLRGLLEDLEQAFTEKGSCSLVLNASDELVLSSSQGMALGLLVTELVINACKHAFKDRESGEIVVGLFETSLDG